MYSGFTLTNFSGRIIGAHQKIDRSARNNLDCLIKSRKVFPTTSQILKFEGKNGPDGLKRKSPGKNEPGHYYNPFGEEEAGLLSIISEHYANLVEQLKLKNNERISFEAAWLAHSIVDGLTPAHHFPYQERLSQILKGTKNRKQLSVKQKIIMPGETFVELLKNNWKMWGPKGLMFTHGLFELGAGVLIAPLSFKKATPTKDEINSFKDIGLIKYFENTAKEIAVLDIFQIYYKKGWTPKLAKITRNKLTPAMIKIVTLAWYMALIESGSIKG
jgi:hypothetical protein